MTTIAELGVRVNSQGVDQAAQDLDRLVGSAVSAESAVDSVGETSAQASARISNMVRASLEASDYHQRLAKAATSSSAALEKANASTIDWTKYQEEINARGQAIIQSQQRIAEQAKKSATAVQEQSTGLDAGSRNLARFNDQLGRTGLTARQTQAAMRGLPAQFTDIFTSLQAGQSPMQVFLQQGGQIKDSFGGIGPALRAVGGYALSLVNPFTVAAAAVGAMALAYKQGSEEMDGYRSALILTGNAAGVTAGQLAVTAKRLADSYGTQREAASALAEVAGRASFTATQIDLVAEASLAMSDATGRSVSETVSEFEKLATSPAEASAKLNEQYRYLTASTYEQIRALEQQGDQIGAANLAMQEYASALRERSSEINENLGYIEKGWKSIADQAKAAWDAMLDIGRPDSPEDKLDRALNAQFGRFRTFMGSLGSFGTLLSAGSAAIDAYNISGDPDQKVASIQAEVGREGEDAFNKMIRAGREQDRIAAGDQIRSYYDSNRSSVDKLRESLEKLKVARDKARKDDGTLPAELNRQYQQAEDALNKRIREAEKSEAKKDVSKTFRDDAATQYLLRLREQQGALEQQLGTSEKLSASQREMAKWEQQIADLKVKAVLTADQKSLLAREAEVRAQLQKNVALEAEARKKEEIARIDAYRANLEGRLRSVQQGYELQIAGLGAGDEERRRIQDRLKLEQEYQSQSAKLQEQRNRGETNGGISQSQYEKELSALDDYHRKALAKQNDYFHQVDEAQKDWSLGARSAFKTYLESARDVAGQTKNLFTSAFSSMEDAVVSFAMTGKLSFSDFAKSVLADMARIATRQAATGIFSGLAGSVLGSAVSGFFGGGAGGTSASDYTGSAFTSWVAGQRASGGTVAPNSLYEVNERGPELLSQGGRTYLMTGAEGGSVVPLGAGRASVAAAGGGSMSISIYAPVTLQSQDQEAGAIDQAALQRGLESRFRAVAVEEIGKATRAGGQIWRSINGR